MTHHSSLRFALLATIATLGCHSPPALIADRRVGPLASTLQTELSKSLTPRRAR